MDFDAYYLKALKYLQYRPRSEKEIRDYLRKKKVNEQHVVLIIEKLKQQKFLNDEEFAKMWIRSRTEFKPKGWRLIKLELQQKGISEEIMKNLGEETRDELRLAKEILEKKRKKFEPMNRQERFNKAGSLLARRGFDLDKIRKAIEEVFGK